jgi:hypothetical protein
MHLAQHHPDAQASFPTTWVSCFHCCCLALVTAQEVLLILWWCVLVPHTPELTD